MLFVILAVTLVLVLLVVQYRTTFRYWEKRGVLLIDAPLPIMGNVRFTQILTTYVPIMLKSYYQAAKTNKELIRGFFVLSTPKFLVASVEIAKNILQVNHDHFTERGFYYNEKDDPLSANLFALGGTKWKSLRTKLSPAYTPGKLKTMFSGLLQCAEQMREEVEKHSSEDVNFKEIFECFTIDVIGCCAFGLECNSFTNPEAEFRKQGKKIFHFTLFRIVKSLLAFIYVDAARKLGIRLFEEDTNIFFLNVVKNAIEYRKQNNMHRKDFLQHLLELNEKGDTFSLEELTAQVFVFFAAGFETSSITLTFCLYEIGLNPDMQEKLRSELNDVLGKEGCLSYNSVMELKYMRQVVDETLRKYPPVSYITRVAVKDYQLPGTDIIIEKGIEAIVPILGIHHDPEYYPDPEKFDPERFSEENKAKRLPFTYMPFGEGPRICIGQRFGLMQVKVGLAVLLKNFRFKLNEKTPVPLVMEPYSFTLTPKGGVYLDVEKV